MTEVFAAKQGVALNGEDYDKNYPEHMNKTIY